MFSMKGWLGVRRLASLALAVPIGLFSLSASSQTTMAPTQTSGEESPDAAPEGAAEDTSEDDVAELPDGDDEDFIEGDSQLAERYRGVEEILVTSQAGSKNLQDMGVSVAAFDADYLDALGAQNIADISQFTPNLEIRTVFAASNPTLFIRGVGLRDFNANSSSSVAVYNDDIYMNSPAGQLGQFFDVQQVEVLRGPQGTLFGRNASAGAIRVISRKPTGDANGYAKLTYGNFNNIEAEGAMEVAITDTLTTRISGRIRRRDGTTLNRCGDNRYKDSPISDGSPGFILSLPYLVHGVNDGYDPAFADTVGVEPPADPTVAIPLPYGSSKGCFNNDTMFPIVPTGASPTFDRAGQNWRPGELPPVDRWVNAVDNWAIRGLFRWQPSEDVDWVLNIHGGMNEGDARQFQVIGAFQRPGDEFADYGIPLAGGDYADRDNATVTAGGGQLIYATHPSLGRPFEGDYNINEPESLKLYGASLTGDIRLKDSLLFKTISGFEGNERNLHANLDGSPLRQLEPTLTNESWQLTQEFKLILDGDGPVTAEVGANYLHENLHTNNNFVINRVTDSTAQDYTLVTHYASAYAWISWSPVEDFSVEAGGRFNYENKVMNLSATRSNPNSGAIIPPGTVFREAQVNDTGISGDITFNFRPTDDHLGYLKYSRGYKGPHINGLVLNPRQTVDGADLTSPVLPEKVDALEFGVKTSWLDNTLTINGSVFYYDYKDIQIFQLRNAVGSVPVQQLINANDADIYGAEIEIRAHPLYGLVPESIDGLEVFASFGWLHSTYTEFSNTIYNYNPDGELEVSTLDFSGNRLINSPELAFSGYLAWPVTTNIGDFTARFDYSFKDNIFFSPANDPSIGQDALWLMNFRLAYTVPDSSVEIAGWVRNLTGVTYAVDILNLARFNRSVLYAMGDPRTFGVTVQARF